MIFASSFSTCSASALLLSSKAAVAISKFSSAAFPMLITSCVAFSMAKDGVSKILSSRWRSIWEPSVSSFPFLLPLIMKLDAFTRSPAKGNKSIVLLTLNTVWKIEISTLLIVDDANTGFSLKMIYITIPKITAPTVLNRRWIPAACFAVLLAPTLEISAVTHVPIFCPSVMKMADCQFTIPFNASVCRIPTDAEELWIIPVTAAPARIPRNGFRPRTANACANIGASRYGVIEADIKVRPINSTPKPTRISPVCFFLLFLQNSVMTAPTPTRAGAKNSGFSISPHSLMDTIQLVTVVPILAPIMMPTA